MRTTAAKHYKIRSYGQQIKNNIESDPTATSVPIQKMKKRTPDQLRAEARRLRELAADGDDVSLKAAVLELAEEFEREAAEAERICIERKRVCPDT